MPASRVCLCCGHPQGIKVSGPVVRVSSNVRAFQTEEFGLRRCLFCASIESDPGVQIEPYYRKYPFHKQRQTIAVKTGFRNRLKFLRRMGVSREDSILDYGCGNGQFVLYLRQRGYHSSVGYDPFVAEYSAQKILDQSYRCIVAQDVLEHSSAPALLFAELSAMLQPGGVLLVGTPNAEAVGLETPEEFMMELHQPYHRFLLSFLALRGLSARFGLEMEIVSKRFYLDSLFPFVNTRFIADYVARSGDCIDVVVEPASVLALIKNPSLILSGFLGFLYPRRTHLLLGMRKLCEIEIDK